MGYQTGNRPTLVPSMEFDPDETGTVLEGDLTLKCGGLQSRQADLIAMSGGDKSRYGGCIA